jgi:hypothetical protein
MIPFKNFLSRLSSFVRLCFGFRETTESGDSDAFLKNDRGSHAATAGESHAATAGESHAATASESHAATAGESHASTASESHAATAGESHAATAGESHAATAGESHAAIADEFPHTVKVSMTQTGGDIWNFSKQGDNIGSILNDILVPSKYIVRYGRNYSFCIVCFRTKQDADFVVNALHGKKVELPKKVILSVEHMDEKPKVPKDKTAPAPASPMKRCVIVKVQSDSGDFVSIRPHDIPFFLYVFGTCPTSETQEEVSERQRREPLYLPRKFDLKICHHVCKRDFLWLKFESEEKAQLAINKMHGQEFIRDEYDSSKYRVVVEPTDLKF